MSICKIHNSKTDLCIFPCVLQEANTRVLSVSSSLTEIEATFRDAYEQAIINTFASYVLNLLGSVNECVTK